LSSLLARYAEAAFWMARYVERAENLARVLDVNETFSRDTRGGQNWVSVLQLYDDVDRFRAHHDEASAAAVTYFYVLDPENPGSILSAIRMARENARTLRPLISTEMWIQLNIFYNRLRALAADDLSQPRLVRLCGFVKESCQAHTGITEGTFYRDAGWSFYQMGRNLERADQTTRLLDVKYHLLLPSPAAVGSPVDISQWNAVLRSASGYHAYRRVQPSGMTAASVAGFLLFHASFPRSIHACVRALGDGLADLRKHSALKAGTQAAAEVEVLLGSLESESVDAVIDRGLHEYIDGIQIRLMAITGALGREFFGLDTGGAQDGSEAAAEG
jgi:uncharacterized alpha-E superfamily protein